MIGLIIVAIVAALGFAAVNFFVVKKQDPGTDEMKEIAGAIREGCRCVPRPGIPGHIAHRPLSLSPFWRWWSPGSPPSLSPLVPL